MLLANRKWSRVEIAPARERANAWAIGDIEALTKLTTPADQDCTELSSPHVRCEDLPTRSGPPSDGAIGK